jgi:hypothetical protein
MCDFQVGQEVWCTLTEGWVRITKQLSGCVYEVTACDDLPRPFLVDGTSEILDEETAMLA